MSHLNKGLILYSDPHVFGLQEMDKIESSEKKERTLMHTSVPQKKEMFVEERDVRKSSSTLFNQ
jgi:hypothetical protein